MEESKCGTKVSEKIKKESEGKATALAGLTQALFSILPVKNIDI